jgi:hypothetical protein
MVDWNEIKGFPLEYSLDQNGLRMKFLATSIVPQKVADDMFKIPSEYTLMSQEDMLKKLDGHK